MSTEVIQILREGKNINRGLRLWDTALWESTCIACMRSCNPNIKTGSKEGRARRREEGKRQGGRKGKIKKITIIKMFTRPILKQFKEMRGEKKLKLGREKRNIQKQKEQYIKSNSLEIGAMVQWLRALTVFPEDLGSFPITLMAAPSCL